LFTFSFTAKSAGERILKVDDIGKVIDKEYSVSVFSPNGVYIVCSNCKNQQFYFTGIVSIQICSVGRVWSTRCAPFVDENAHIIQSLGMM